MKKSAWLAGVGGLLAIIVTVMTQNGCETMTPQDKCLAIETTFNTAVLTVNYLKADGKIPVDRFDDIDKAIATGRSALAALNKHVAEGGDFNSAAALKVLNTVIAELSKYE